ncbi:hypothetical protein [Terrisporobacter sp.]
MKMLKKFSVLLLTIPMAFGSIFAGNTNNSYAQTSYKKQLALEKTYKYDLDGDGDKDSIKLHRKGSKLYLIVNGVTKKLDSYYNPENNPNMVLDNCIVRIYDLNKKDKSLDIVSMKMAEDNYNTTRILKFKNKTCKLDKSYFDATLKSYDSSNGMITLEEYDAGRYTEFVKAIGCFCIYDKVKVNVYNIYNQYTANVVKFNKQHKYIAAKKLTAYTGTSGSKKAFTINKGSKSYIYELYQNGSKRYIKVKNSSGKYGYVKVGTSMLFTNSSCLWWR